jgi:hypothetical protein
MESYCLASEAGWFEIPAGASTSGVLFCIFVATSFVSTALDLHLSCGDGY